MSEPKQIFPERKTFISDMNILGPGRSDEIKTGFALSEPFNELAALRAAILEIDAKATPYGPSVVESGEEYAKAYLIPAGPLHRALGLVGHTARKVGAQLEAQTEKAG